MSSRRATFDINENFTQPEPIWNRLGEVAVLDFISNICPITVENAVLIKALINHLVGNKYQAQAQIIIDWIFNSKYHPNKFELMLLYNQCETHSKLVKQRLGVSSSNVLLYRGKNKVIKQPNLPTGLIFQMVNTLSKYDWTKNNYYKAFINAKWK